jgi:peptidoglycan/xylan/chitin deacetylase (PgdA/CDA1 family)
LVSLKQAVKAPLQWAGASLGRHRWPVGKQGSLLVLTYHRVLPDDHPDRNIEQPGMIVSPATLAMHLDVLSNHFAFVHLDDWLDRATAGDVDSRRCCAITFDDGWRDNFQYAFPVLEAAGAPATFFLVTARVGSSYEFWPNRLQRYARLASRPDWAQFLGSLKEAGIVTNVAGRDLESVDCLIEACKSLPDATLHELLDETAGVLTVERDLMNWDEIRMMANSGLARFGSHSRNHTRLVEALPEVLAVEEIVESKRDIEDRLGTPCKLFCYPNGDASATARAVVNANYSGAVSTESGWTNASTDRLWLRRVGLHEDAANTRTRFLSRIGGFL